MITFVAQNSSLKSFCLQHLLVNAFLRVSLLVKYGVSSILFLLTATNGLIT